MTARPLDGVRVAVLERPHPPGHRGAITAELVPLLAGLGAEVELVHAERGLHRLDRHPGWDAAVLKSGSAAALHLAAAARSWGIPVVNSPGSTALARDKAAAATLLAMGGLPVPQSWGIWLDLQRLPLPALPAEGRLVVKAARGSQGQGLWWVESAGLRELLSALPAGPYLVMRAVPHAGDDLKVYVVGDWMAAIERPFPATSYVAKLGRSVPVPAEAGRVARRAADLLGLECCGCDFVAGPDGWTLVDVNAFPGYKGVPAAGPLARVIASRVAARAEVGGR